MIDISLASRHATQCNGLSRRGFLRLGALAPLGLSLPSVLSWESALAGSANGLIRKGPRAKSVLLVYLGGGLSHHDSFDLKPGAIEEIRGKYTEIPTNVTGLKVGNLLPKMAQTMDKVCLVRSGAHDNDHHETATNWVLSEIGRAHV